MLSIVAKAQASFNPTEFDKHHVVIIITCFTSAGLLLSFMPHWQLVTKKICVGNPSSGQSWRRLQPEQPEQQHVGLEVQLRSEKE